MGVEGRGTGCLQSTLDSSGKVGMGTQAWGVCVCMCDGVNGAAERQFTVIGWGGLQAEPASLLPKLYKQTQATGQQDSDLGALPGTALAPVSQGTHLLSCS